MWQLLKEKGCSIEVLRIQSKENPADELSRNLPLIGTKVARAIDIVLQTQRNAGGTPWAGERSSGGLRHFTPEDKDDAVHMEACLSAAFGVDDDGSCA